MYICSNVVAATDVTVLAMAGIGLHEGKVIFISELHMVCYFRRLINHLLNYFLCYFCSFTE